MIKRLAFLFQAMVVLVAASSAGDLASFPTGSARWIGTWAAAPQLVEVNNLPPNTTFADKTLRQVVQVSIGGRQLRVRLSNEFGGSPLQILSAHIAKSAGGPSIIPGSDRTLLFAGQPSVVAPAGTQIVSDPVSLDVEPRSGLTITIRCGVVPIEITGHPGSRTTSFLADGDAVTTVDLVPVTRVDHWYFIKRIDVLGEGADGAIAIVGDSITDGRGSTTNGNDRWPDQLASRLAGGAATAHLGVLNAGIGGNRVLADGLGPSALARLDRDVLAQAGVRWLVVFEGVNDLGAIAHARQKNETSPKAADLIAAFDQIIYRAHAAGIRVYGGTITPFGGSFYDLPRAEADRTAVNLWIRTSGHFDAVIDFDAAVRDPQIPTKLAAIADCGDHLHLTPAGYRLMAEAVELNLFHAGSE